MYMYILWLGAFITSNFSQHRLPVLTLELGETKIQNAICQRGRCQGVTQGDVEVSNCMTDKVR